MENGEQVRKVSHLQFMQAVDRLRKDKQEFLDSRPDHVKTAKMLSERLGFPIYRGTAAKIKEASGVHWESRRHPGKARTLHSYNATATLARALNRLYKKLGEEVPTGLQDLVDHFARIEQKDAV